MIGADANPKRPIVAYEDGLDLAARVVAAGLDLGGHREPGRGDPVEQRRGARRLDPELVQLLDVLVDEPLIAAGPASDHGVAQGYGTKLFGIAPVQYERRRHDAQPLGAF